MPVLPVSGAEALAPAASPETLRLQVELVKQQRLYLKEQQLFAEREEAAREKAQAEAEREKTGAKMAMLPPMVGGSYAGHLNVCSTSSQVPHSTTSKAADVLLLCCAMLSTGVFDWHY